MAQTTKPIPEGFRTVTPALALENAAQTIEFYKKALGAEEVKRNLGPDGKVMHAELTIGDSRITVADVMEGTKGPRAYGGSPIALWLYVENSDALFNRAVAAGATVQMPMADQFWGDRAGAIGDPEGYTWWIGTRKEELTPAEINQRMEKFFKEMAHSGAP